jgi:hypothetical protein
MIFALCDSAGRKYQIGIMLRIGRDPANQIVLQDPRVSQFHATLAEYQGKLLLRDEKSTNGTFVNQAQIQGLVRLQAGDRISIGDVTFSIEQVPEQIFMPSPSERSAKKMGFGCSMWPLAVYLVLFMACLGLFAGVYYLYKAPRAIQQQALTLIGQGPATIEIENLGDTTVYIMVTSNLDRTSTDASPLDIMWEMSSFGANSKNDQNAGAYRIDFGTKSGGIDLGTCTFNIKSGEVYHFVVIPNNILIDRTEYPSIFKRNPSTMGEFLVATSTLCKFAPK